MGKAALVAGAAGAPAGVSRSSAFRSDYPERCRRFDFYDLSYTGGAAYKYGCDVRGLPVLVEHEMEVSGSGQARSVYAATLAAEVAEEGRTPESSFSTKFDRRQRVVAYENHVRPIVDKISAYLTRTKPHRDENVAAEAERVHLDETVSWVVGEGLKLSEAWIGFDAAHLPDRDEDGAPMTALRANAIDPVHGGRHYLVRVDPRRVVDYDEDPDGCAITRVVVKEEVRVKPSFTSPEEVVVRYREWTAAGWVLYEETESQDGEAPEIVEVGSGAHSFGVCPYERFRPKFPVEDLCELSRLLFNIGSVLDEELFNNTFTQKWITGMRPEDVSGITTGATNTIVLQEPMARIGVLESVDGQAASLIARMQEIRDQIYAIVSMEGTATKNVAESAEKKKRDLESLYTMLVKITEEIERVENSVLAKMGVISADAGRTEYDRHFDVLSLTELMDQVIKTKDIPFFPASYRRNAARQLLQKLDPFGNQDEYRKGVDQVMDATMTAADAVSTLKSAGLITPEMAARALGVPEADAAAFVDAARGHDDPMGGKPGEEEEAGDGDSGDDLAGKGGGPASGAGKPRPAFAGVPGGS